MIRNVFMSREPSYTTHAKSECIVFEFRCLVKGNCDVSVSDFHIRSKSFMNTALKWSPENGSDSSLSCSVT